MYKVNQLIKVNSRNEFKAKMAELNEKGYGAVIASYDYTWIRVTQEPERSE